MASPVYINGVRSVVMVSSRQSVPSTLVQQTESIHLNILKNESVDTQTV